MSTLLRAVSSPSVDDVVSPAVQDRTFLCDHLDTSSETSLQTAYPVLESEESLVVDCRATLTPAQMVERKLHALLRGSGLPVSQLQMANCVRSRNC
jgi:hypothetical protein